MRTFVHRAAKVRSPPCAAIQPWCSNGRFAPIASGVAEVAIGGDGPRLANRLRSAILTAIAPNHAMTDAAIGALFDRCANLQAGRVQYEEPAHFQALLDQLTGAASEAETREIAWARHEDWIRGLWEREPIFHQSKESGITLARTYLPLRCFWHEDVKPEEAGEKVTEWDAHVGMLHETVRARLDAPDGRQLQLVAGSPGCGKSSFARALAVELLDDARKNGTHRRVLLIRLEMLRMEEDLAGALASHLAAMHRPLKPSGGEGLPDDPLAWLKQDDAQLVILFDGLDELSHDRHGAQAHTNRVLIALKQLLGPWRAEELLAIVLGRSVACQDAMRAANLNNARLLHVLPLRELNAEDDEDDFADLTVLLGSRRLRKVEDPKMLLKIKQRQEFYLKSAGLLDLPTDGAPEAVTAGSMEALNAEPLLLYLLMISGFTGERWQEAEGNPNVVYEAIFQKVHAHNTAHREHRPETLSEPDFFTLMECLGLSAWQGAGRTGGEEDFERIVQVHADEDQLDRFDNNPLTDLKNVAIQIYTRGDFGEGKGFEFVHKKCLRRIPCRAGADLRRAPLRRDQGADARPEIPRARPRLGRVDR
jgi:DNA polymerase III delta prime subunit